MPVKLWMRALVAQFGWVRVIGALVVTVGVFLVGAAVARSVDAGQAARLEQETLRDSVMIATLRERDSSQSQALRALADSQAHHRALDSARDADFETRAAAVDRRAEAYMEERQAALDALNAAADHRSTLADGTTAHPDTTTVAPAPVATVADTSGDEALALIAQLRAALGQCRGMLIAEREHRADDAVAYRQRVDSLLATKDDESRWRDTVITHQDAQLHPKGLRRVWRAIAHVGDEAKVPLAVVGGYLIGRAVR